MIKRLLAIILSLFIISTVLCAVTVSAETTLPVNIATDYVPGEITGNVITSENLTSGNYVGGWGGGAIGDVGGESAWEITTSAQVPDSVGNANSWGVLGRIVGDYDRASVFEAGENVVVSYQAKNSTGSPVMKVALYQNGKEPLYALEYPGVSDGTTVTNSEWKTYSHTLAIPESGFVGANNVVLCVGIGYTGIQESRRGYWLKGGSMYVGKEYAYDINVTAEKTDVMAGERFVVDADIVNQGGSVGGVDQNVTWYALNSDRTEVVSGISITEGSNGGATVEVAPNVSEGTYCLVAVSETNENLVKGITITVSPFETPYLDYVAGEVTGNMITPGPDGVIGAGWGGKRTFGFNGAGGAGGMGYGLSGNEGYFKNLTDVSTAIGGSNPVVGFIINTTIPENTTGNVVYSFDLRANNEPKSVINFARVNTSVAASSSSHIEYAEDEGIVPSANMQTYTGIFEDRGVVSTKYAYRFGFVNGTELNATSYFNTETAYLGYEYAHDIVLNADKTEYISGEKLNLEAYISNQVGSRGGLAQDITWLVMNTDRTVTYTEGFTVTPAADGKVTVEIDPFLVDGGDYDIVAYSATHGMAKGVTITVPDEEVISTMTLSDFLQNTVTATVNLKNKTAEPLNAVFVVFMVNERNQITDIEVAPVVGVTSADGKKVYTLPLTATDISKVVSAKACLFDCGTQTLPTVLNSSLNELTPSLVVVK